MAERKIHNYDSVVLAEKTLEEEGFNPNEVGYQKKHVWATCRFCGEPHRVYGANLKKSGSACHKACRLKEQSISGSPFANKEIRKKAQENRTKNISQETLNNRISVGRKKAQSKIEKTNLKKYGVRNPFQSEEIKEKIRKKNLQEIGVDHHMKDPERVKRAAKVFDKTVQIDENDRYKLINLMRGDEFWDYLGQQDVTLDDVSKKFDVPYNSLTATLIKDEFKDKYYETYNFPKYQAQKKVVDAIGFDGKTEQNTRQIITPLELDIYYPEKQLAIEFNGSHWHSEVMCEPEKAKLKHLRKTRKCQSKGIRLIHIFEHQWYAREKQFVSFIRNSLGCNQNKIMARKCSVDNSDAKEFIENNHIQGLKRNPPNGKYFNLIYGGEVVASTLAAGHHRKSNESSIVLSRMCFKSGVNIAGGANKMFKAMTQWAKEEGYNKIISWSDNAWTEGRIYETLGFIMEEEMSPDYFYWDMANKCYKTKQSQQKKATGCPEGMTERDWCIERGLYRIWDCGKKRWVYEL